MDEFESRLTDDLSIASSGVKAGPGLEGALKRKVRRRHAAASIAAAVPMLLLIIGAVWLVNSSDEDGAFEFDTVVEPEPEPTKGPPSDPSMPDPLRDALVALGVDVESAPVQAIALDGADWCGVDNFDNGREGVGNQEARRCLLDAWDTLDPAVIAYEFSTIEGDPIIEVQRMTPEGYVIRWVDSTRDRFGSGEWNTWYCTEMDRSDPGVDPIFAGANDCNDSPPGGFSEAAADEGGVDGIALAPGEPTTIVWPDQSFFWEAAEEMDLFVISEGNAETSTRSWAFVGTAVRNDDGTSTLSLIGPTGMADLAGNEFAEATPREISDGVYDLVGSYSTSAITRIRFVGSSSRGGADVPPEVTLPTDGDSAILGGDGLADAVWGDVAADVLPDFAARFGPPVSDRVLVECLTLRKVEYANGLRVWFSSDTDFTLEKPDQAGLAGYRYIGGGGPTLTTRNGLTLGSSLQDIGILGGGFNGGYDSAWGAYGWFLDDRQGGRLTYEMTDPRAKIGSISAGALRNPDRMVC